MDASIKLNRKFQGAEWTHLALFSDQHLEHRDVPSGSLKCEEFPAVNFCKTALLVDLPTASLI